MKTVLLVDDDSHVRATYGMALRKYGYRVIEAESGVMGLQLARQHLPDLIVSDVDMPGGDGSTLVQDIRRDPELRSKQVVLMTGRPDLMSPRKSMEEGADDFLLKPVSKEALISCVEARFRRASISWRVEDQMLAKLRSCVPPQLPHEIFTPMAGIIGLMEILNSGYSRFTSDEVQAIHRDLHQSVLRLNRTLRNYLLILDLQASPSEVAIKPLSPTEVETAILAGVEDALRLSQRREDVTVRIKACALSIKLDDLSRVVEELVDNACIFSRHGTPIIVEMEDDGRLCITDKGRGMTTEEIQSIGAFQQFDHKTHEQKGLGIGLVLVQKLSALCRAKFRLDSQPGEGTRVEIVIPSSNQS